MYHRYIIPALIALCFACAACAEFEKTDILGKDADVKVSLSKYDGFASAGVIFRGGAAIAAEKGDEGVYSFVRPAAASGVAQWYLFHPYSTGALESCGRNFNLTVPSIQYPPRENADRTGGVRISEGFVIGTDGRAFTDSLRKVSPVTVLEVSGIADGERVYSASVISPEMFLAGSLEFEPETLRQTPEAVSGAVAAIYPEGFVPTEGLARLHLDVIRENETEEKLPLAAYVATSAKIYIAELYSMTDTVRVSLGDAGTILPAVSIDFNSAALASALSQTTSANVTGTDGESYRINTSSPGMGYAGEGIVPSCIAIGEGEYMEIPGKEGKETTEILFFVAGNSAQGASLRIETADGLVLDTVNVPLSGMTGGLFAISKPDSWEDLGVFNLSGLRLVAVDGTVCLASMAMVTKDFVDPHGWEDGSISDTFIKLFKL